MNTQQTAEFAHTHARRLDPVTSHAAALKARKFAASHAGRILSFLRINGPRSAGELALHLELTVVQVDRRLPDLKAKGLALPTAEIRGGCRVWKAA